MMRLSPLIVLLAFSTAAVGAEERNRGNPPVIEETPWGQQVVATLDTHVDIETYKHLHPGQAWSDGAELARQIRADYDAGRLVLRRNPWQVAPGVWSLGPVSLEQQSYLIDTGEGLLLVDPSLDKWQEELIGEIRTLGFTPEQVKWVLLTHCHIDHSQSCHLWRARGATILVGAGDVHALETGNRLVAIWVEPQAEGRFTPCPVDRPIHDGDILQLGQLTLDAISTPGHTPGSTCFHFERDSRHFLISGDVALHNGRHAWMGNPYADWDAYLKGLQKLQEFAVDGKPVHFDVLLPGHGTVDMNQASRSVDETIKVVRHIIARRAAGEKIDWVEPYPWNWSRGVVYSRP